MNSLINAVDPEEVLRIHTEITVVGNLMGECINDFINLKISRKVFDERMASYADRIETARRDEDRLIASLNDYVNNLQKNDTQKAIVKPLKTRKK